MGPISLGLVGLRFRVRDKVRVSVRDRVGVRVNDGARASTFYFSSHQQPTEAPIPAGPHFTHNICRLQPIYSFVVVWACSPSQLFFSNDIPELCDAEDPCSETGLSNLCHDTAVTTTDAMSRHALTRI